MMATAAEQGLVAARHTQLHGGMCNKLAPLVSKLSEPLPALNAERHRWRKSGVQALSALHLSLQKSRALLQYCTRSSKLYLGIKGHSILSKFEDIKEELTECVRRLSILVPQDLVLQMAGLETELEKTDFTLDPTEKQICAEIMSLILQKQKGGYFENPQAEQESFSQIAARLALTTVEEIGLERQLLERQLLKAQRKTDKEKVVTVNHLLYLLETYSSVLFPVNNAKQDICLQYSFSRLSWSGSLDSISIKGPDHSAECNSVLDPEVEGVNLLTRSKIPVAPEEFRCPISLQLMADPVIVASGQTYEKVCIEKWFREGHVTCPKTQQVLAHLSLTPNYCVKGLIAGWCEAHGISIPEAPSPPSSPIGSGRWDASCGSELKRLLDSSLMDEHCSLSDECSGMSRNATEVCSRELSCTVIEVDLQERGFRDGSADSASCSSSGEDDVLRISQEHATDWLPLLMANLKSRFWELQCQAAEQIRVYTKRSSEARLLFGQAQAIPALVDILYSSMDIGDVKAQEICALALLNLAVNNDRNKSDVVGAGAVPLLVKILRVGENQSVKESAAAAILTLSCLNDNKACIGSLGAIPLLVQLLISGSNQGRKDALTTLYNLTILTGNRHRVIRAGAIPILVHLLSLRKVDLVEKCIALLYNLSFTQEGRVAIAHTEAAISTLSEILEAGSDREKEQVVAIFLVLCSNSTHLGHAVLKEGVIPSLVALTVNGTTRAQDKAQKLLQHFREQRQKKVSDASVRESVGKEDRPVDKEEEGSVPIKKTSKLCCRMLSFNCKPSVCSTGRH